MPAEASDPAFPFTPHVQWPEASSAPLPFLPPRQVEVVGSFMLGALSKPVREESGGEEWMERRGARGNGGKGRRRGPLSLLPLTPLPLSRLRFSSLQAPSVDVAVEVPAPTFGPRWPWLNYRYHNRRNAYLAHIKQELEGVEAIRWVGRDEGWRRPLAPDPLHVFVDRKLLLPTVPPLALSLSCSTSSLLFLFASLYVLQIDRGGGLQGGPSPASPCPHAHSPYWRSQVRMEGGGEEGGGQEGRKIGCNEAYCLGISNRVRLWPSIALVDDVKGGVNSKKKGPGKKGEAEDAMKGGGIMERQKLNPHRCNVRRQVKGRESEIHG